MCAVVLDRCGDGDDIDTSPGRQRGGDRQVAPKVLGQQLGGGGLPVGVQLLTEHPHANRIGVDTDHLPVDLGKHECHRQPRVAEPNDDEPVEVANMSDAGLSEPGCRSTRTTPAGPRTPAPGSRTPDGRAGQGPSGAAERR